MPRPYIAFSATPIDLANHVRTIYADSLNLKPYHTTVDFNHTTHVRLQQMYKGYPIWGANGVRHLTQTAPEQFTMNGRAYENLDADLDDTPASVFSDAQSQLALDAAAKLLLQKYVRFNIIAKPEHYLMVYVDKDNKAHWAFYIAYNLRTAKPVYIIDAQSFQVYKSWNNYQTAAREDANGGGIGGNIKMGRLVYDGLAGHLNKFPIKRDAASNTCYLENDAVIVKDSRDAELVSFPCPKKQPKHNNVYWNTIVDKENDGYSPNTDAIYGITFIKQMYEDWYDVAPVTEDGKPVPITVYTHEPVDNASWLGKTNNEWVILLGDGGTVKYPSTAIGVIAHEVSHGFTEQHSNLVYSDQSGGLNESFSDMSDQAAQYYAYNGKNNWMHDAEITKAKDRALRYLDQPSKDCYGTGTPGVNCSIDNVSQYNEYTDVHYSSGIFNRVFYLIGTADGWDAKKAFDVMLKANSDYWIPNTTFSEAACGVISATKDYNYDLSAVLHAFSVVGVETSDCLTFKD